MLRVPTQLAPSSIHGLGVFATQPIPKGTVVWDFDAPVDQAIHVNGVRILSPWVQKYVATYGYREGNTIILCGDDARYFNHSKTPNCRSGYGTETVAIRDIAAGEELTDDYETFDDDYPNYAHLLKASAVPEARKAAAKSAQGAAKSAQAAKAR